MSIWNSICKIGSECKQAVNKELDIFKEEVCGGKSIIECAKDSSEYKEMKDSWRKLTNKNNFSL